MVTSIAPPPAAPVEPAAPPPRGGRRRLRKLLIVAVALVLGWFVPTNTYAISPGSATAMDSMVTARPVGGGEAPSPPAQGSAYMADVYVTSLNLYRWLGSHVFDRHADYVGSEQILGPSGNEEQVVAEGYVEMSDSKDAARVAAFTALGLEVAARPMGARIDVVSKDGAAAGKLSAGDRVVAVNGASVRNACGLIRATRDLRPGTTMRLRVERAEFSRTGALSYAKPREVTVTVGQPRQASASSSCPGVTGPARGAIGVSVTTSTSYRWPVEVAIRTELVGGPSAGLAMTLQVLDELSGGAVLQGRRVAATGTMATNGVVGPVGGVGQKAVAVADAGVATFLVPRGEGSLARAEAGGALRVVEVQNLGEALKAVGAKAPLALSPAWARAVA